MKHLILGLCLACTPAWGAFSGKDKFVFLTMFQGEYILAHTTADEVTGASYLSRFRDTLAARVSLGFVGQERLYLGFHYESWFATRRFDPGTGLQTDTLQFNGGGPEAGLIFPTPRSYLMASMALTFPLLNRIESSANGLVEADENKTALQIRVTVGFKISAAFSLVFGGGYKIHELGTYAGTSLPAPFDLSGFFGFTGIGLHF